MTKTQCDWQQTFCFLYDEESMSISRRDFLLGVFTGTVVGCSGHEENRNRREGEETSGPIIVEVNLASQTGELVSPQNVTFIAGQRVDAIKATVRGCVLRLELVVRKPPKSAGRSSNTEDGTPT